MSHQRLKSTWAIFWNLFMFDSWYTSMGCCAKICALYEITSSNWCKLWSILGYLYISECSLTPLPGSFNSFYGSNSWARVGIQVYHKGVQAYFHYFWYDVHVKNTSTSSLLFDSTIFQVDYAPSLAHNHCRYLHFLMSSHRRLYINWALLGHRLRIQNNVTVKSFKLHETLVIHLHGADNLASTNRACCARKGPLHKHLRPLRNNTRSCHIVLSPPPLPPVPGLGLGLATTSLSNVYKNILTSSIFAGSFSFFFILGIWKEVRHYLCRQAHFED